MNTLFLIISISIIKNKPLTWFTMNTVFLIMFLLLRSYGRSSLWGKRSKFIVIKIFIFSMTHHDDIIVRRTLPNNLVVAKVKWVLSRVAECPKVPDQHNSKQLLLSLINQILSWWCIVQKFHCSWQWLTWYLGWFGPKNVKILKSKSTFVAPT